jgi:hypothetical protein
MGMGRVDLSTSRARRAISSSHRSETSGVVAPEIGDAGSNLPKMTTHVESTKTNRNPLHGGIGPSQATKEVTYA